MVMNKNLILLTIADLKVSKLLKDDETGVEYAAPVDVPGVKDVKMTLITDEKTHKGDGVTLATSRKKTEYDVSFSNAVFNFDIMALIDGSTVQTSGSGDTETVYIEDSADEVANYFALEMHVTSVDGEAADYHQTLYKVRGGYDIEHKEDDYAVCSFTGKGVARMYDKKFGKKQANKTAAAITQIPTITAST